MRTSRWLMMAGVVAVGCALSLVSGVVSRREIAAASSASTNATASPAETEDATPRPMHSGDEAGAQPSGSVSEPADTSGDWDETDASLLHLSDEAIRLEGEGATVEGNDVTIVSGGVYVVRGSLTDGRIVVDVGKTETVELILDGARISNRSGAAIYVVRAEETLITLAPDSVNEVDGGGTSTSDGEGADSVGAAIFSADDLRIDGEGELTVRSPYGNGIQCRDDLEIAGGGLLVVSAQDGVKARDSIAVRACSLTIDAGADGLQASQNEDPEKGTILIESGTILIDVGGDGIQAETDLTVRGGEIVVTAGGGHVNAAEIHRVPWWGTPANETGTASSSRKGLKAGVDLCISGGSIRIDAADDAIHSNDRVMIDGGILFLSTGDDGIHSDATLIIDGGEIEISESYEGIESSAITINGGTLRLTSRDDGINAAGGNDGVAGSGPGWNRLAVTGDHQLSIHGGTVVIDAGGDGIDANGPITMTQGTVIIQGPTGNMNGALDYSGSFDLRGGILVAVGSAGMAQAPSTTSGQNSVAITFGTPQAAGQLIHIESSAGEEIVTFLPSKTYQSAVVSVAEWTEGSSYTIYLGGSSTGAAMGGLYLGGVYTKGTEWDLFTVRGSLTSVRATGSVLPAGGRRRDG